MAIKISRILHAGYLFETEHTQILIDPIFENPFSRNCYAYPAVEFNIEQIKMLKPAAVFISHHHDDHCSFDSLKLLNRDTPIYMFCMHAEMFSLLRELGFKNVFSLKLNQSIKLADLEVITRKALDSDVDSLFQIKSQGLNILNVVDSWIDEETLSLLLNEPGWDLILWPFQTMREVEVLSPHRYKAEPQVLPEEWLSQLTKLNPKNLIPSSCQFRMEDWSWYNQAFFPISYAQFNKEITTVLPETNIIRLNPGRTISLNGDEIAEGESLNWIKPIGEQDVDYHYNPTIVAQTTSEIAKHFQALGDHEDITVRNYCEKRLLDKFTSLGPAEDSYFIKTRTWQLSLFDHTGFAKNYYYQLKEENITLLTEIPALIDWITEVSEKKLHAALELGESLTSMYIRIVCKNEEVDILQDPLIRCLFSEGFAEYQKAQLKKILNT
ncbi:MAG: MBL fold metallo-hydrolase [Bdellovibrionota bacterium]